MSSQRLGVSLLAALSLFGCATPNSHILEGGSQVELRSYQSRSFDTADKVLVVRNVISTMQDLSFVIDNADAQQGIIAGKKYGDYPIEMTVTVQPISSRQILVHGIAQYNLKPIEDPFLYEQFFSSLQEYVPYIPLSGD